MKLDLDLFDSQAFRQSLKAATTSVPLFKEALDLGKKNLKQRYELDIPTADLIQQTSDLVDQLLLIAWESHELEDEDICLAAVGGYGRRELHPGSDIDLAIITAVEPDEDTNKALSSFVTFLWDIGLEVGLSVRTLEQCSEEAKKDISVATNLMEARLLAGNVGLFHELAVTTGPNRLWSNEEFFSAKYKEQIQRHKKYGDTAHNLEPNIKEGPGGLRDIQMIGWVVKRYFNADTLQELVVHDFLTEEEFQTLNAGQAFLWRVRYVLHLLAGRREDRLLFEYQKDIAAKFGFYDDGQTLAVESFMKLYYRTITELSRLNEMLLDFFYEVLIEKDKKFFITPINTRFQIRNKHIKISRPNIFKRYPFALLEIFLLMQQNPSILGVRAKTIRAIRNHLYLIDDTFRKDIRNRSLFMEIMRQPKRLGHELQRMHRYGVLAAYLPPFEAISGLMQFDLFHVYTVDEHTLMVLRNLRRYSDEEVAKQLPLCAQIYKQIPKPEVLYLAGLFHDIAKGRGGDHSLLGVEDAITFCEQHELGRYDVNFVAWLVKSHLRMSTTAQKKDLSDANVINEFARYVGDKTHLDYLYLLTVADIRGTNPSLWNGWKDSLHQELYKKTLHAIRRGIENLEDKDERITQVKEQVMSIVQLNESRSKKLISIWQELGDDYFLRHSPDEIAWETKSIIDLNEDQLPLIKIRPETRRGATEIFIYCRDKDSLFAAMTYAMDQLGLTVVDARIFTTESGYNLDTYLVLEAGTGKPIDEQQRADDIAQSLKQYLLAPQPMLNQINRMQPRKLRSFNVPATISFSEDAINNRTILEVTAMDQPGLLAVIGMAMAFCGVRLQNAKIATFGERVEDIFYLTDRDKQPITETMKFQCLEDSILSALNLNTENQSQSQLGA